MRHTPSPKDVFERLESDYPDQFHTTRKARLRTRDDYSIASFLYHHYALNLGLAVESNDDSLIVRHSNYRRVVKNQMHKQVRFFCVNDGGGSAKEPGFIKFKASFLETHYPFKSHAE